MEVWPGSKSPGSSLSGRTHTHTRTQNSSLNSLYNSLVLVPHPNPSSPFFILLPSASTGPCGQSLSEGGRLAKILEEEKELLFYLTEYNAEYNQLV